VGLRIWSGTALVLSGLALHLWGERLGRWRTQRRVSGESDGR
jgi:hypothetical protein